MRYVLFASYGNDSVALIQWAHEVGLKDVDVLYSDTGWSADYWPARVEQMEAWVRTLGFHPHRTTSLGMEALVKEKRGWPGVGMQFCTINLKIKPALEWLDQNDPNKEATCLVGIRREESLRRASFPEVTESSPNHGDRRLWAPLVDVTEDGRNELIRRAGFDVLNDRSRECWPCIHATRHTLRDLAADEPRIQLIERIESELGTTKKGTPRTMFRASTKMGATGIREVIRWAESERGKFVPLLEGETDCEGGFCGA